MARPRREGVRIYTRKRGPRARYYADLREYADVLRPDDPIRQALVPEGETMATSDADVARKLAAVRVEELERRRRARHLLEIKRESTLEEYAAYHLEQKAAADAATEAWLAQAEMHLRSAVEFFGAERILDTIGVEDVQWWAAHLARRPARRPGRCPECGGRKLSLSGLAASCAKRGHAWRVAPLSGGSDPEGLGRGGQDPSHVIRLRGVRTRRGLVWPADLPESSSAKVSGPEKTRTRTTA